MLLKSNIYHNKGGAVTPPGKEKVMLEIIGIEPTIEEKIHILANHYSKKNQYEKAQEEVEELREELRAASNPFGFEDCVYFADNTWSEIADVIIMCAQLAMQHGKEAAVREQMEYKVSRQLKRIEEEKNV